MKKRIAILGSTGSIGRQALEQIAAHASFFEVEVLTAQNNADLLIKQAIAFQPNAVLKTKNTINRSTMLYCLMTSKFLQALVRLSKS